MAGRACLQALRRRAGSLMKNSLVQFQAMIGPVGVHDGISKPLVLSFRLSDCASRDLLLHPHQSNVQRWMSSGRFSDEDPPAPAPPWLSRGGIDAERGEILGEGDIIEEMEAEAEENQVSPERSPSALDLMLQGVPRSRRRFIMEKALKIKSEGEDEERASRRGFEMKIGAGVQLAGGSIVSRRTNTASISLAGQNGLLQVIRFYGNCYRQLSKAHLSFFVVSTAAVGFVMGSGEVVDWMGLIWTSVGTMLAASSANAFNQILEVANDARMKRTMRRPLPSGRISKGHALAFALIAGIAGVTLLACETSVVAAELAAANIVLYSVVYTPLKQIHYINTWVGAVVGGIPPLLGWAAASGQVDAGAWVLAGALYFWQIPHFMSLAFLFRGDYTAGGYKMLSLLDSSGKRTALCALRNCMYLLPLGFLAQHWGTTSGYFGAENVVLTAGIGATAAMFYLRPGPASARKLFRTSLLYLPILMTAMVVHRIPNPNVKADQLAAIDTDEIREFNDFPLGLLSDSPTTVDSEQGKRAKRRRPLPPISLLSAAPFPFLPAPDYP